ncbi:MAG: hypothetical protein U5K84_13610 [Alkalibacterium sp.]|nr:hypothetical protein [Alkalibacterium sp.]
MIYQAYPKSFKDTDGNGMGILNGVIEKLPYFEELGIDMLWPEAPLQVSGERQWLRHRRLQVYLGDPIGHVR